MLGDVLEPAPRRGGELVVVAHVLEVLGRGYELLRGWCGDGCEEHDSIEVVPDHEAGGGSHV